MGLYYCAFWSYSLPFCFAVLSGIIWILAPILRWKMSDALFLILPFIHLCSLFSIILEATSTRAFLSVCDDNEEDSNNDNHESKEETESNAIEEQNSEGRQGQIDNLDSSSSSSCLSTYSKQLVKHGKKMVSFLIKGHQLHPAKKDNLIKVNESLRPGQFSIMFVLAPSIALLILLVLRLTIRANRFEGYAPALDFGPRGSKMIAFDGNSSESYMHCLAGFLSTLLVYPAIPKSLRFFQKYIWFLFEIVSSLLTLYPTCLAVANWYTGKGKFHPASYAKNCFEWALGTVMGISLGLCITGIKKRNVVRKICKDIHDEPDVNCIANNYPDKLANLKIILGYPYLASVFVFAFYIGLTWYDCADGTQTCIVVPPKSRYYGAGFSLISRNDEPTGTITLFCSIPLYIWVINFTKERLKEQVKNRRLKVPVKHDGIEIKFLVEDGENLVGS